MFQPTLIELENAVAVASDRLSEALAAGGDTGAARQALLDARAVAEDHRKSLAAAERARRAAVAAETEATASAAADEAVQAVVAAVERVPVPEGVNAPTVVDPEVAAAAAAFARLRSELERSLPDRNRLETEIVDLKERAASKRAAAAAISARRLRGTEHNCDAAELSTLTLDADGLDGMIAHAEVKIAAMRPNTMAQQQLQAAEERLVKARNRALLMGLIERQRAREASVVAGAREIRLVAYGFGQRNLASVYLPSDDLRKVSAGYAV